jgi:hypothetical protein
VTREVLTGLFDLDGAADDPVAVVLSVYGYNEALAEVVFDAFGPPI